MNKQKIVLFAVIVTAVFLIAFGYFKGDLKLVESFGRFICLDCIGIS